MTERKGASYKITQKRAAQNPAEHAQPTQASAKKIGRRGLPLAPTTWEAEYKLTNTSAADVAGSARPVPMG